MDDHHEIELGEKCLETINRMKDIKTMIDYDFLPYNTLKYTHKSIYHHSGSVSLGSFIIFVLNFILLQFTNVTWFLVTMIVLSLIVCIISFGIFHLKPRRFTITERSYVEDETVKLYELIPKKEVLSQELKPYIDRAIDTYIQSKIKEVTNQYMKEVITQEEYDIKDVHVLELKMAQFDDDDDEG